RLFFAPHAVDGAHFDPRRTDHRERALALREEHRLEGRRVVLFAGKLVDRKDPALLLRAFARLRDDGSTPAFVGDGPEKAAAGREAATLAADVRFLPFSNQSEMPAT